MAKPITTVNQLLKRAGREERLRRGREGYYYMSGAYRNGGLYVYALDDNPHDHKLARDYVEEALSLEDGKPFKLEVVL